MIIDKVVRNVYSIGGGITVSAFGISLASSKVGAPKFSYPTKKVFSGEVKSIDDIEDLEYTNGCKFFFYDPKVFDTVGIKTAREFPIEISNKGKIVQKVNDWLGKNNNECPKGRFIYVRDLETTQTGSS